MAEVELSATDAIEEAYLNQFEDEMGARTAPIEITKGLKKKHKYVDMRKKFAHLNRKSEANRKMINYATVEMFEYIKPELLETVKTQPPVMQCQRHLRGWMLGDKNKRVTPRFFLTTLEHVGAITCYVFHDVVYNEAEKTSFVAVRALVRRLSKLKCTTAMFIFGTRKRLMSRAEEDAADDKEASENKVLDTPCRFVNGYFEISNVPYEIEAAAVKIE